MSRKTAAATVYRSARPIRPSEQSSATPLERKDGNRGLRSGVPTGVSSSTKRQAHGPAPALGGTPGPRNVRVNMRCDTPPINGAARDLKRRTVTSRVPAASHHAIFSVRSVRRRTGRQHEPSCRAQAASGSKRFQPTPSKPLVHAGQAEVWVLTRFAIKVAARGAANDWNERTSLIEYS